MKKVTSLKPKPPVVLICCDHTYHYRGTHAHVVRDTYVRGLVEVSKCLPLLLPVIGNIFDPHQVLDMVDGIVLTGSDSNVSPKLYGQDREFEEEFIDDDRDMTTLPLLKAAMERDVPVFAICRGFQELNVACGGSLHQHVHKLPGKSDHRKNEKLTMMENFHNPAHPVVTQKGGLFQKWGMPKKFSVNSLHGQGIDVLGKGLYAEALADDGMIEAISMPEKSFIVGVQWHPEGDCPVNAPSERIFEEFGKVLRR